MALVCLPHRTVFICHRLPERLMCLVFNSSRLTFQVAFLMAKGYLKNAAYKSSFLANILRAPLTSAGETMPASSKACIRLAARL